jgi:hypothetical protein
MTDLKNSKTIDINTYEIDDSYEEAVLHVTVVKNNKFLHANK